MSPRSRELAPVIAQRHLESTLFHTCIRVPRKEFACFIAQIAFPLTTFGPRLSIHPAVIVRARDRPNAGAGMCVDAFQDVPWRATVFCSVY